MHSGLRIISGTSNRDLVHRIIKRLGVNETPVEIKKFSNGETTVNIRETIRNDHIYIIQSFDYHSFNDQFMEFLVLVSACKGASCKTVTAVLPMFPYARADKKDKARVPITAKLVSDLMTTAGVDHVISMDLHSPAIQGFFNIPVDNLFAEKTISEYINKMYVGNEYIFVSPDSGGVKRVSSIADRMNKEFVVIHKERKTVNKVESMLLIGDVTDQNCIIVDDMADTLGTLASAAELLKEKGAKSVVAIVTHPILSGDSIQKLQESQLDVLTVTNTLTLDHPKHHPKIDVIDISDTLSEAIRRTYYGESISSLFV